MATSERFADSKARLRLQMAALSEQEDQLAGQRALIKQVGCWAPAVSNAAKSIARL